MKQIWKKHGSRLFVVCVVLLAASLTVLGQEQTAEVAPQANVPGTFGFAVLLLVVVGLVYRYMQRTYGTAGSYYAEPELVESIQD